MKIVIQSAQIFDKQSPFHKKEKNVLIQNGKIVKISEKNISGDKTIKAEGMILSPGWFDLGTFIGDPGLEHKEDIESGTRAAMAGGFTEIAILPNTVPSIQTKNDVSYIKSGNNGRLVQAHAMASVTKNNRGEELTEMIDLNAAGAVAFTDGLKPIWHTDILLKTLQYLQKFDGVLIDHPEDIWLNIFGQMHEGVNSTMLGLRGMPRIAEEIVINRNLEILKYAGGRLHFAKISSGKSVELIKAVKKKLNVSCGITAYQPLLDDSMLFDFDTHYKVNPPLREKEDNDALIKGLKEGVIDVICSGHIPQDEESKKLEFDLADFGIINLQTVGANLVALEKSLSWETLLDKVTAGPRKVLGMDCPTIAEEEKANLTLFDPTRTWVLDDKTNESKARNSPWYGKEITGRAVAVFNNGKNWIDN